MNIVRLLIFNLAFLSCAVLLLEMAFGEWFSQSPIKVLNVPQNVNLTYNNTLYPGPEIIHYHRDAHGLRGSYPGLDKVQIVTFGGSTADQRYITDGQTWQDFLQRHLQKHGHKNFYVANAGIDGQSTYGHIANLRLWIPNIPDLHAKYYLFYIGVNELYGSPGYFFDDLTLSNSLWANLRMTIIQRSALYRLIKTLKGILVSFQNDVGHNAVDYSDIKWTDKALQNDQDTLIANILNQIKINMGELVALTRAQNAQPIFVTQQTRFYYRNEHGKIVGVGEPTSCNNSQINGMDRYFFDRAIAHTIIEQCQSYQAICIDAFSELELDHADYYDHIHNTPQGAEKIGVYLAKSLLEKLHLNDMAE